MTPPQVAQQWCDKEFGGDWKKACDAAKTRDCRPFPLAPVDRGNGFAWVMLGIWSDGVLLVDDGMGEKLIPWRQLIAPR